MVLHPLFHAGFSWLSWHWHLSLIVGIALLEGGYLLLVGPLRRYLVWPHLVRPKRSQIVLFTLGVAAFLLAEQTPLHDLSEQYLFSAHMFQHVLLALVMPPLLLLGTPGWLLRPLLCGSPSVERIWRLLTHPLVALVLFNAVFATWHVPAFYQAALLWHNLHILQHLLLIGTGVLVWWPVLSPMPEFPRPSLLLQMLYLFALAVVQTPLFALLTFSNHVLYPWYAAQPRLWGISPETDQQIGGVIMKVSSMFIFLSALAAVFFSWFSREEKEEAALRLGGKGSQPQGPTR
ncbi:MAG: cytochrome c oxidase assembly protein [Chloroflexi bacterium]|nr:cytochrome c oxidase assembly protein [Chloroflexota bacterium]